MLLRDFLNFGLTFVGVNHLQCVDADCSAIIETRFFIFHLTSDLLSLVDFAHMIVQHAELFLSVCSTSLTGTC